MTPQPQFAADEIGHKETNADNAAIADHRTLCQDCGALIDYPGRCQDCEDYMYGETR